MAGSAERRGLDSSEVRVVAVDGEGQPAAAADDGDAILAKAGCRGSDELDSAVTRPFVGSVEEHADRVGRRAVAGDIETFEANNVARAGHCAWLDRQAAVAAGIDRRSAADGLDGYGLGNIDRP